MNKREWPKGRNSATHCSACGHRFFVGEPRFCTTADGLWCRKCKDEADDIAAENAK